MTNGNKNTSKELLTPSETADYLRVPLSTLARWRCEDAHLSYVTLGRRVLYRIDDIQRFIERNVHEVQTK